MKSHFGGAKQRRLRSDEKPVPRKPDNGSTCHAAECATCHETVCASDGGYWDFDMECLGWKAHAHQPAGDDVFRADPLNGWK